MRVHRIKDGVWVIGRKFRNVSLTDPAGGGLSRMSSNVSLEYESWSESYGWDERPSLAKKFPTKEAAEEFMKTIKDE